MSSPGTDVGTGTDRAVDRDFESWLVAREPALRRLAVLLTGDPHTAADLVQQTLTKMYLAWPRLADRGNVDAYARRTLVNAHRSWWRRAFRRREVATEALPDRPAVDRADGHDGEKDAVWQLVCSLPPRQRAVLVLRYYEELSEAEIAEVLGVSTGTVKSQASRALAALRTRVPEELAGARATRASTTQNTDDTHTAEEES